MYGFDMFVNSHDLFKKLLIYIILRNNSGINHFEF